jgi:hypothetical protein
MGVEQGLNVVLVMVSVMVERELGTTVVVG